MKVLVAVLVLAVAATAQQQDAQQQGLREFIQHLMSLDQRNHQVQDDEVLEIPDDGVYEIYQDPSEVAYYRNPNQENYLGYINNNDKYESSGKLSYHAPLLHRPKRQTQSQQSQSPANNSPSSANNPNRLSTFINTIGALGTNIRRQTSEAIRNTLRGNLRPFQQNASPHAATIAAAQQAAKPTSLNDVYGATLGARSTRTRRSASVDQSYAAVIDYQGPVEIRSAVERSEVVPQVAFFETAVAGERLQLLEEPPFDPIFVDGTSERRGHSISKRSPTDTETEVTNERQGKLFSNQDPLADLFRPLQEIFGIVNATAQAIFRDVVPPANKRVNRYPQGFTAISKHEFKINDKEGTVVQTEARPSDAEGGPVTAKIHMKETFYNPSTEKFETFTHEETVMVPLLPPMFSAPIAAIQNFDPKQVTDALERIAVPFQRAFTNFTTELGLSIFKATHNAGAGGSDATSGDAIVLYPDPAEDKSSGESKPVTLDYFRPEKVSKDKSPVNKKPPTTVFVIKEENIYKPNTESNVVPAKPLTE